MKLFSRSLACLSIVLFTATAEASIQAQVGAKAFGTITRFEDFQSYATNGNIGVSLTTADYVFSGASAFAITPSTSAPNPPSKGLYQNGGFAGRMVIASDDGADFNQLQFDVGEGHGSTNTVFAWITAYNNGASTGYNFDLDVTHGGTFSLWSVGTAFDEIRIGAYRSAAERNVHNATGDSGLSVDNVTAGTTAEAAPEPMTLVVWVGLIAATVTNTGRRTRN